MLLKNESFSILYLNGCIGKIKAGDLVKYAAIVTDGNGGGRPDFAQSGGKDGSRVSEALEKTFLYMSEVKK